MSWKADGAGNPAVLLAERAALTRMGVSRPSACFTTSSSPTTPSSIASRPTGEGHWRASRVVTRKASQ